MLHLDDVTSCFADCVELYVHSIAWHQHLLGLSFGRSHHITVSYHLMMYLQIAAAHDDCSLLMLLYLPLLLYYVDVGLGCAELRESGSCGVMIW